MTTTAMEPYDAQMLDYQNDLDIQMHASSSDPWFQDEAPMEDDGNLTYHSKGAITDATPSIEVDMEAYVDDQHIEYDMADDHHSHDPTPGEVLDVDLLDASRVQSPFVTVTPLPLAPSAEYSLTTHSTTIPLPSELSLPTPHHLSLEHAAGFVEPISEVPAASSEVDAPSAETEHQPTSSLRASDGSEVAAPPTNEEASSEHHVSARHGSVASQSATQALPAAETGDVLNSNPSLNDVDRDGSHSLDPVQDSFQSAPDANAEELTARGDAEPQQVVEGAIEHIFNVEPGPHDGATDMNLGTQDLLARSPSPGHGSFKFTERVAPHEEKGQEIDSSSNEVSEEVYLDAPPPILLAIFSTDHPELCLFNTPEPLPNEDDTQERHILLQQAPNLYYEPLAHVFEVLRQDEYVSTVLEITGNELAFDAYDLELTISEDNIFAREISLHDIHLLHTSSSLAGHLRLRLHIIGPRFIVRYHMLQEGLVHLHVDESQDSDTHEEIDDSEHEEQQHGIGHVQGEYADTDGAVSIRPAYNDIAEHPEDRPEEGGDEHTQEYDEAEGMISHGGEIDLSALPPFVDSPDEGGAEQVEGLELLPAASENAAAEQIEEAEEPLPSVTTISDGATTEHPTENIAQRDPQSPSLTRQDTTGLGTLEATEDNTALSEETAQEPHEDYDEGQGAAGETGEADGRFEPQDGDDGDLANEDSEELHPLHHAETTPQPEAIDHTNYETLTAVSADTDNHESVQEISDEQQYVGAQANPPATEELRDLEDETWDDELDGEGDPDTTWETEQDNGDESLSNESSVTLSSKASKRSFDELGFENSDDEDFISVSPGSKRARVE